MSRRPLTLLSVDWDFFYPDPWRMSPLPRDGTLQLTDWGTNEEHGGDLMSFLWAERAAGFIANGRTLPGLSGEEQDFWSRFRFAPEATGSWADSHSQVGYSLDGVRAIWSYDAHHDAGYGDQDQAVMRVLRGRVRCDDWALAAKVLFQVPTRSIHVRYPRWATGSFQAEKRPVLRVERRYDDPAEPLPVFDRVFLARSGTWVPPWLDQQFGAFLAACPVKLWPANEFEAERQPREWKQDHVDDFARQLRIVQRRLVQ